MPDTPAEGQNKQSLSSVQQLLSDSWQLYREKFPIAFGIFLGPIVIIGLSSLLLLVKPTSLSFVIPGFLLQLVGILFFFMSQSAFIIALSRGETTGESYRSAFKLFWPLVWILILTGLVIMGGFVMLIIPGILLAIQLSFTQYVLIFENKRGLNALLQSREYVRGYWGAVCWRYVVVMIITIVFYLAFQLPALFLSGKTASTIVGYILYPFIAPFSIIYAYKVYENLRTVKPSLPTSEAPRKKGFFITSAIIGLIAPITLFILFIALFLLGSSLNQQLKLHQAQAQYYFNVGDVASVNGGQQLADYIVIQLNRGVSREVISNALVQSGWNAKDINSVFSIIKQKN